MKAFLSRAPPSIANLFPSLLSHLNSLPMSTYNRRHPHNRLPNDIFTLLFQRKLRLPLLPPPLLATPCRYCKRPFDPYGDHLFRCYYNKKILSDNIRDAVYTICSNLAPMAQFVHSKHGVLCEPANLLPNFPGKRPADIGLTLRPSALACPPPHPVDFLAIDITVTKPPTSEPPAPAPKPTSLTKAHLESLRRKLTHSTPDVHGP